MVQFNNVSLVQRLVVGRILRCHPEFLLTSCSFRHAKYV